MKGISHFATGLCLASFVPGVAADAALGSLCIALGGAAGLLPDTLDFRIARFFDRRDADLMPDPLAPDPQALANAFAAELQSALTSHRARTVQLHPFRRGTIDWVLYALWFDPSTDDVCVRMSDGETVARAAAPRVCYHYDGVIDVGELGGPSLRLSPNTATGVIDIAFLPWHRERTHSLLLALLLGVVFAWLAGWQAGLCAALGFAGHVLEDQLGHMGSNLFWPLTQSRTPGLGLLHASDAAANTGTVWLSLSLLLLNLDRARSFPLIPATPYILLVVLLPFSIMLLAQARSWLRRRASATQTSDRDEVLEAAIRSQ